MTDRKARIFSDVDAVPVREHEERMNAEIEATVEDYKAGMLTFKTLDEVMADHGFDAR